MFKHFTANTNAVNFDIPSLWDTQYILRASISIIFNVEKVFMIHPRLKFTLFMVVLACILYYFFYKISESDYFLSQVLCNTVSFIMGAVLTYWLSPVND